LAAAVATFLGSGPQEPRWAMLPRFVPRDDPQSVEDLSQSRIALEAGGQMQRR
jgi:hypothetical protein